MASDTVPNIRFNVAKTLQSLIPLLDNNVIQTQVKPCLTKLYEDSDRDVKYYATLALQAC
jgi:serine/threonine-protein phosphatase 2A regulatory subunit A